MEDLEWKWNAGVTPLVVGEAMWIWRRIAVDRMATIYVQTGDNIEIQNAQVTEQEDVRNVKWRHVSCAFSLVAIVIGSRIKPKLQLPICGDAGGMVPQASVGIEFP